jgi:hypothetical protein
MPSLLNQAPALLAALLLLVAYGLPGVGLLRRFASEELDEAELWIYGIPLGAVICSLVVLVAASMTGLSLALVLIVAAVAAGVAVRPAWAGIREWQGRVRGKSAKRLSWFAVGVLGLFLLRWVVFWATGYRYDGSGLHAANTGFWADWALHIGDVSSFVHGGNFPPVHPRYIGEPYAYHYLVSVTAAAMAKLGGEIPFVLLLQSLVLSTFVLLSVFAFARRLTRSANAAALGVILFFLGGTLGWLLIVSEIDASHSFWRTLLERAWDGGKQESANFRWQNLFFSLVQPQRSFLYGIPLGLLSLSLLESATASKRQRAFVLAGIVAALLPFANLSTLLSLALVTPFLFLLFPSRRWAAFFGVWIAGAVPQLWIQQNGGAGAASAFRMQLGWIAPPDPWLWFWLKNAGLFIPLLLLAVFDREALPKHSRRFLLALMPLFAIANIFVFQPWDWDNTKILLYWYLGGCILVAAMLARAWTTNLARAAVVLAVLSITLSGILANLNQLLGRERTQLLTAEELEVARTVRETTPRESTFAVGLQHNHPVPMLSGRKVVLSYTGWLWSQGYDYAERERDLRDIYAFAPRAPELLAKYDIDYLVVGPWERAQFGSSPELFRRRYPTVLETANYAVFDVRVR